MSAPTITALTHMSSVLRLYVGVYISNNILLWSFLHFLGFIAPLNKTTTTKDPYAIMDFDTNGYK